MLGESDVVCTFLDVLGIVDCFHLFLHVVRIVGNGQLDGIQYGRDTSGLLVEVIANSCLKQSDVIKGIKLGVTD